MCKILIYLGNQEIPIFDLLYGPDNSLIRQSFSDAQLGRDIQNLAGFGFCAWTSNSYNPSEPFYYKTTELPFFDNNLYRLSNKISASCFLAHVRGVAYEPTEAVVTQNVHPFKLKETSLAFAHNGNLSEMLQMKLLLTKKIKPEILSQIKGTTDSEWIYALFLSQLKNYKNAEISLDEAWNALIQTLVILKETRQKAGTDKPSPVNLCITNGEYIIVTRFVYDYNCTWGKIENGFNQYHSLWATFGESYGIYEDQYKMYEGDKRKNILFASEPLTKDKTTWIELPEYSITKAWIENKEILFRTHDLVL